MTLVLINVYSSIRYSSTVKRIKVSAAFFNSHYLSQDSSPVRLRENIIGCRKFWINKK